MSRAIRETALLERGRTLLVEHWPLAVLLGVASGVRVVVAIAYRPALFFSDSWSYVALAYSGHRFAPDRPSGYPLLLELIGLPGHSLTAIITLQHAAGLAVGLLVYVLLIRAAAGRAIAAVAAGLVLLNAYAVVLEQTILAEAFFTLAIVASFYLITRQAPSALTLGLAGVFLAGAVTMRTVAVFAVPIWLLYTFYSCRLRALVALVAVALPLIAYAAVHESETGKFGLTTADGWFLYGRVGEIADCTIVHPPADTRDLCEPPGSDSGRGPLYYIWSGRSAANRRFPHGFATPGSSDVVKRFAVSAIAARPRAYAGLVARDTLRYFVPGAGSVGRSNAAINLPARPRRGRPLLNPAVRDEHLPGFDPQVHPPAALARGYAAIFRVPRPLLALMIVLPLFLIPLAIRAPAGARPPHVAEALLMSLSALAMLLGPSATSGFDLRYLVPTVPLIVCGGALALCDLMVWRSKAPTACGEDARSLKQAC